MVTPEEIGSIAVFAGLSDADRERLSRAAADITLAPGEYAAHEGGERALFAVLDGRIEAVKLVDGIPRVVGERQVGDIFGEVPIVLGTFFPVGFRAAETTRVLRIEPNDYHAVASVQPDIAKEVGRLAADRMSGPRGLQGIAAEPPPPRAIVVGHRRDASLRRAAALPRPQPDQLHVDRPPTRPTPPRSGAAPCRPTTTAHDPRRRRQDRRPAAAPPRGRAARRRDRAGRGGVRHRDRRRRARRPRGRGLRRVGGPAHDRGRAGGAGRPGRHVVPDRELPRLPGRRLGRRARSRALQQARRHGAEILVTRTITRIDPATRQIHLDGGDVLRARTIILACGVAWRQLEIEGFDRLAGKGISYGAARSEAANMHGQDVHIVGAGNSAGQAAMFFSTHASSVTLLCRGDTLEKSMSRYLIDQLASRPNIRTLYRTEVVAAHGDASLEALEVRNGASGETTRLDSGGLFIFIGADAETGWLPPEIALDRRGYVLTGADVRDAGRWELDRDPYLLETSVPGIFASGDVRFGPVKRVAAAVGEGSMAIAFVHQYLKDE